MVDFITAIADIISFVANGISNFVDFIISIPNLIYNLLSLLPNPLATVVYAFIGYLITVIFIKVVSYFV